MAHEGEVESSGRTAFNTAMVLAFQEHRKASHVLFDEENNCIVFFWHEPDGPWKGKAQKLFKEMTAEKAADYAWEWAQNTLKGTKPRYSGDDWYERGFRIKFGGEFRLYWKRDHKFGPEDGSPYGICAVFPAWHEVHK